MSPTAQMEMTLKVIDANERYFDAVAGKYDEDPAQRYGCYHENSKSRYRRFLRDNMDLIRGGLVLNLGCGTGNMMDVEEEMGLRSIGVDISWAMLKRARKVSPRLIRGEVHQLPFADGSVRLASGFLLLHHIYDHDLFFKEIFRALVPGGVLFCDYDPNFYPSAFSKDHWLLGNLWRIRRWVSYRVMKVGDKIDVETARLADYYSETVPGLKQEEIGAALARAGFHWIRPIVHSDGKNLARPAKGRSVHKTFEGLLWLLGEKDYARRAKLFAVVAQKPGGGAQVRLS